MKRQRGRNRGGNTGGGGGGGKPSQNVNRAFDSNGPDGVKIRGHAQHVYDKYCQLARDAASAGDRVLAENYTQHAEHYFRVLRVLQPTRPASEITGRDVFASGFDIDVDEDGESDGSELENLGQDAEAEAAFRENQYREAENRETQNRNNQIRDNNQGRDNSQGRDRDAYRDQQPRDQQPREGYNRDRQNGRDRYESRDRSREDRPRDDRPRDDRPRNEGERTERPRREDRYRDRDDRRFSEPRAERSDPLAVVEPQATPLTSAAPAPPPQSSAPAGQTPLTAPIPQTPLQQQRPPVQQTPLTPLTPLASAPVASDDPGLLRSQDGGVSQAPAFLGAPVAEAGEPVKRPRGRPRKIKAEDAEPAE